MNIRQATADDSMLLANMACQIYETNPVDLVQEFAILTASSEAVCFLACDGEIPIGFAQCQLRYDYVEGTSTSPVGFLDGVWVAQEHRHQGVARQLVEHCQQWALEVGCSEFASDCEINNLETLAFHLSIGFEEAGRTIWFHRRLTHDHSADQR